MAFSLACLVLRNDVLQNVLQEKEGFKYADVLYLLHSQDKVISLQNIRDHLEKKCFLDRILKLSLSFSWPRVT